jgi:ATP-binding protein involved in chromosome partitioning
MSFSKEDVLSALRHVDDPDLHKDLVTLGMIEDIVIEGNKLSFSVYLTTPACPMKDSIENACRNAIAHFIGEHIEVNIHMTSRIMADKKVNAALPNVKHIIAVGSGKGGVGKSTVSTGIAAVLSASGAKVGIMDADIYGPSIPILFGIQNAMVEMDVVDGKELMRPVMAGNIKIFSIGFLSKPNEAVVWRGPMVSSALKQFINGVNWGELDYLIVDLPPGTGDVQLTLVQNIPLTGAVIVTTPQKLAVADAVKACAMFSMPAVNVRLLGIVENMSFFEPEDQPGKKYHIFGSGGAELLAQQFHTRVLGSLPIQPHLVTNGDEGKILNAENIVFFTEIAGQLVRQVAINQASQ